MQGKGIHRESQYDLTEKGRSQGIRQNSSWWSWWFESSPIRIRRQFLNCSSLSFLLISLISSMNISISSPSPPNPSLICLLGMAHRKLGASRRACPLRLWLLAAGWWPSPPPKGRSSCPFCRGCSISSFSWWIFAMVRFCFLVVILWTQVRQGKERNWMLGALTSNIPRLTTKIFIIILLFLPPWSLQATSREPPFWAPPPQFSFPSLLQSPPFFISQDPFPKLCRHQNGGLRWRIGWGGGPHWGPRQGFPHAPPAAPLDTHTQPLNRPGPILCRVDLLSIVAAGRAAATLG